MKKNKYITKGFTLLELMFFLAILTLILVATTPIITRRAYELPERINHGKYVCTRNNNNGQYHEELYDERGLYSQSDTSTCKFTPSKNAKLFKIELVGAGAGGYDYASITDIPPEYDEDNFTVKTQNLANGYNPSAEEIKPRSDMLANAFGNNTLFAIVTEPTNAYDGKELDLSERGMLHNRGFLTTNEEYQQLTGKPNAGFNYTPTDKFKSAIANEYWEGLVKREADTEINKIKAKYLACEDHNDPKIMCRNEQDSKTVAKMIKEFEDKDKFKLPTSADKYQWTRILITRKEFLGPPYYQDQHIISQYKTENNDYKPDIHYAESQVKYLGGKGGKGFPIKLVGKIDFKNYPERTSVIGGGNDIMEKYLNNLFTEYIVAGVSDVIGDKAKTPDFKKFHSPKNNTTMNDLRKWGSQEYPDITYDNSSEVYTEKEFRNKPLAGKEFKQTQQKDKYNKTYEGEGAWGKDVLTYDAIKVWDKLITNCKRPTGGKGAYMKYEQNGHVKELQFDNHNDKIYFRLPENGEDAFQGAFETNICGVNMVFAMGDVYNSMVFGPAANWLQNLKTSIPTVSWKYSFNQKQHDVGQGGGAGEYKAFYSTTMPDDCKFKISSGGPILTQSLTPAEMKSLSDKVLATELFCNNDSIKYSAKGGSYNKNTDVENSKVYDGHEIINADGNEPTEYSTFSPGEESNFPQENIYGSYAIFNSKNFGKGGDGKKTVDKCIAPYGKIITKVDFTNDLGKKDSKDWPVTFDKPNCRPNDTIYVDAKPGKTGAIIISW